MSDTDWIEPPHTWAEQRLAAGVWPKKADIRGHFQIVGDNARALVVCDLGGLIDIGGVHVSDPVALDEAAARLRGLAEKLRRRQGEPE